MPLKGELKYTDVHIRFIYMGGFEIQCTDGNHRLSLDEIKDLITNRAVSVSSFAIAEEEIFDRSKTDGLSKLITCLQILWFVIQLAGRAVQHLPTTGLELFTLGIVVCSLGTYAAYWRMPQDIRLPITVPVGEGKALRDVFGKRISHRTSFLWDERLPERWGTFGAYLAAAITGIFGACHLIGWNFLYPSLVEQLLWRICSITCVVTPFLIPLLILGSMPEVGNFFGNFLLFCAGLTSLFYFLARVYLLVAIFVSLRSVSAGVYQTVNWSLYFPHL